MQFMFRWRPPCLAVVVALASWLSTLATASINEQAFATTSFGRVTGNLLQDSKEFLGIPFAPQPDRFMPPRQWTAPFSGGSLEAKQYPKQCHQVFIPGYPKKANGGMMRLPFSEDCLYLNIYTPREEPPRQGWPVLHWIHGGGLLQGTASDPAVNASRLAGERKVVVVAANYRLGVFGFAAIKTGRTTIANNGFRDQQEAMRWVRSHIGSFGGNPKKITIFGESAGGESVGIHVVSPSSAGLFDQAISESADTAESNPLHVGLKNTVAVAKKLGCGGDAEAEGFNLVCLQELPAERLISAIPLWTTFNDFKPVIDGDVLPGSPLQLFRDGQFNKVPFVMGVTEVEGDGLVYPPLLPSKPATYEDLLCTFQTVFGKRNAKRILEVLPGNDAPGIDNRPIFSSVAGNVLIACPSRRIGLDMAKHGHAPWFYIFQRHSTPACGYYDNAGYNVYPMPSAGHGIDIPYQFGTLEWLSSNPRTVGPPTNTSCDLPPEDRALEKKVMELWSNFALTGAMPDPGWPRFQHPEEASLKLGMSTSSHLDTEEGHFRGQCEAFEAMNISAAAFLPLREAMIKCQDKHQSRVQEGKEMSYIGEQKHDAERPVLKGFPAIDLIAGGAVIGGLCGLLGVLATISLMRRIPLLEWQQTDNQVYTRFVSSGDAEAL